MLGLINDCTEQLVITQFGLDAWHTIKANAGCKTKDYGFERHGHYPDSTTVELVSAAAELLGTTVDAVLELFGKYFLEYTRHHGYDNLLRCQGSTLRLWLSNLNALHDHLQSSLPTGSFPVFWCEDCESHKGSILLHYYSVRGSLLAPVVVGLVKEIALFYIEVEISMERVATQGQEGSECTTWRISAVDPQQHWRLTREVEDPSTDGGESVVRRVMERRNTAKHANSSVAGSVCGGSSEVGSVVPMSCPFSSGHSSRSLQGGGGGPPSQCPFNQSTTPSIRSSFTGSLPRTASLTSFRSLAGCHSGDEDDGDTLLYNEEKKQDSNPALQSAPSSPGNGKNKNKDIINKDAASTAKASAAKAAMIPYELGLPSARVRSIFPYHVMVSTSDFRILQTGRSLPGLLLMDTDELIGKSIKEVLKISRPVLGGWDMPTLLKLADQTFFLSPLPFVDRKTGARIDHTGVKFKGNMIQVAPSKVMFVLSPDAENITELTQMGLTMSDLPLHSFQRDVVFLGEHIASEVRTAHKLDKLSKRLEKEKNLSNTLLHSMLPPSVADELRSGKTVEPLLYENVTLFFSDVVGFTSICDAVEPWGVIDMLNQLYTVMDHLAQHFNLYKVETIGDAYMCCSGMPTPDDRHAQNIANFALAVSKCVGHVLSPVDDATPLQLRIGIHTGSCMGGVVGTLTPHYCLFGDAVNTTARHESTGQPGKIQCSSVLHDRLKDSSHQEGQLYEFTPRGHVQMKGKGTCYTYWLDSGSDVNQHANPSEIQKLYDEVGQVLAEKTWKKRQYFSRRKSCQMDEMSLVSSDMFLPSEKNLVQAAGASKASSVATSSCGGNELQDRIEEQNDDDHVSLSTENGVGPLADDALCSKGTWKEVSWRKDLTRDQLVACIHDLLSDLFWKGIASGSGSTPENRELLEEQLRSFVKRIAELYNSRCLFHSWDHACHVVLGAYFLIEQMQGKRDPGVSFDISPWSSFVTVFAALVHDVKHLGVPNRQLEFEEHALCEVYDQGSCQERQSIHAGIGVFVEEFPDLSKEVFKNCPAFAHLVTTAVLSTDIACKATQLKVKERFGKVMAAADGTGSDVTQLERTEVVIEQILLLADVGHCSQGYQTFLRWNRSFYGECLANFEADRGDDPRDSWFDGQIGFLQHYILPLAERCEKLMPHEMGLKEGVEKILMEWKNEGQSWTSEMISSTTAGEEASEMTSSTTAGEEEESKSFCKKKNSSMTPFSSVSKKARSILHYRLFKPRNSRTSPKIF